MGRGGGMCMQLTKEVAIKEHRKMWNWIAEELENMADPETQDALMNVEELKEWYTASLNLNLHCDCFCCEYTVHNTPDIYMNCDKCPLVWGSENNAEDYFCESRVIINDRTLQRGLWLSCNMLSKEGKYKEAAELAKIIAELPEKEY